MNRQIYEEAAEWLVEIRIGDIDAAARARLDGWFRLSPEHIRAFLELSNIWEECADKEVSRAFDTAELIARARAAGTNVVTLDTAPQDRHAAAIEATPDGAASKPSAAAPGGFSASVPTPASFAKTAGAQSPAGPRPPAPARPRARPWRSTHRVAASIAFLALLVGSITLYRSWISTYTTGIGEQRTITLADGSRVELNARSRIRVRFSKHERDIELLAGQALFRVAKDSSRPFIVASDDARVRAVGTQFDVYRKSSGTTVTVIEGRVAVLAAAPRAIGTTAPRAGGGPSAQQENFHYQIDAGTPANLAFPGASPGVFVSAGEQVIVTAQQISKPEKANTVAATAWTQRELVFDETPLTDVAAEFNLYNDKPLIVSDASLKDFHVTGVFSSTNPTSLLAFLRAQKGIRVQETDEGILIARQ